MGPGAVSERLDPERILLVTGMSGAGKSTALNTLEDLGWEVVDNLPLKLLDRLLDTPPVEGADKRPLAIGIDSRTRGFEAAGVARRIAKLRQRAHYDVATLFLDCSGAELERRYDETRRPHPLALDRPASDGIMRERELLAPLRQAADYLVDTTQLSRAELQNDLRTRFGEETGPETVLTVTSFGFARGLPRNADLVFDMRFLRNPHWDRELKPMTGLDSAVGDYIAEDPAYEAAVAQIEELLLTLLPRYASEGKAYVTVAFGCTGGRHRSVHVAERVARRLREAGFSPTVTHRDLATAPRDAVEEIRAHTRAR
ncbi:RNase adapter RapZ [Sphingomonas sp. MAH-20]|uniref:RNase adapter RapZ n=1 Tax=Sphingomonas horti TaxID=2682842 RepID=A0A6I4J5L0_9SPHN|nr:RNase adapter RapZ [Sphingomonas sp. CGMCC 1.13658]MVO78381.1 RNase adapter RapZ [Sphingomonas horti]